MESVEGNYNSSYIAPNSFIHAPAYRSRIWPNFKENLLPNFLIHAGRTHRVPNTTFRHAEDDWLFGTSNIAATIGTPSNSPGAIIEVQLSAASHQESGKNSPFLVGDIVTVHGASAKIQCLIIDKDTTSDNAHTITLDPVDSTENVVAQVVGGSELITLLTDAFADGTGQPKGMVRKPLTFYNDVQIFKTSEYVDGGESANVSIFTIDGKPYYYLKGVKDTALRHYIKIQFGLIFGKYADGLTDIDGKKVHTTRGLEEWQQLYGMDEPYSSSFQIDNLKNIIKGYDLNRPDSDKLISMEGSTFCLDFDDLVHDRIKTMGTDYTELGVGSKKETAVDFGFRKVHWSGYDFFRMKFDAFHYKPITGYAGSPWPGVAYIMPYAYVRNQDRSAGAPSEIPTIGMAYKQNDLGSRFERHWTRDYKITNVDQFEWHHFSELGLQVAKAHQIYKAFAQ